jgi:hypothetical protein
MAPPPPSLAEMLLRRRPAAASSGPPPPPLEPTTLAAALAAASRAELTSPALVEPLAEAVRAAVASPTSSTSGGGGGGLEPLSAVVAAAAPAAVLLLAAVCSRLVMIGPAPLPPETAALCRAALKASTALLFNGWPGPPPSAAARRALVEVATAAAASASAGTHHNCGNNNNNNNNNNTYPLRVLWAATADRDAGVRSSALAALEEAVAGRGQATAAAVLFAAAGDNSAPTTATPLLVSRFTDTSKASRAAAFGLLAALLRALPSSPLRKGLLLSCLPPLCAQLSAPTTSPLFCAEARAAAARAAVGGLTPRDLLGAIAEARAGSSAAGALRRLEPVIEVLLSARGGGSGGDGGRSATAATAAAASTEWLRLLSALLLLDEEAEEVEEGAAMEQHHHESAAGALAKVLLRRGGGGSGLVVAGGVWRAAVADLCRALGGDEQEGNGDAAALLEAAARAMRVMHLLLPAAEPGDAAADAAADALRLACAALLSSSGPGDDDATTTTTTAAAACKAALWATRLLRSPLLPLPAPATDSPDPACRRHRAHRRLILRALPLLLAAPGAAAAEAALEAVDALAAAAADARALLASVSAAVVAEAGGETDKQQHIMALVAVLGASARAYARERDAFLAEARRLGGEHGGGGRGGGADAEEDEEQAQEDEEADEEEGRRRAVAQRCVDRLARATLPGRCAGQLAALALAQPLTPPHAAGAAAADHDGGASRPSAQLPMLALRALGMVAMESAEVAAEHAAPAALRVLFFLLETKGAAPDGARLTLAAEAAGLLSALALRWPGLQARAADGQPLISLDDALVRAAEKQGASPPLIAAVARLLARGRLRLSPSVLSALLGGAAGASGRALRVAAACGAASRPQLALGLLATATERRSGVFVVAEGDGDEQRQQAASGEASTAAAAPNNNKKRGRRGGASSAPAPPPPTPSPPGQDAQQQLRLLLDLLHPQDLADDALVLPLLQLLLTPPRPAAAAAPSPSSSSYCCSSSRLPLALLLRSSPSARARAAACSLIAALPEPLQLVKGVASALLQKVVAEGGGGAPAAAAAAARLQRAVARESFD